MTEDDGLEGLACGLLIYTSQYIIQSYPLVTEEAAAGIGDDSDMERLGLIVVADIVGELAFCSGRDEFAGGLLDDADG